MSHEEAQKIKSSLMTLCPAVFESRPVLFAYLYGSFATGAVHPFSDLDIGVYVENLTRREYLQFELSLALEIDEKLDHSVGSDVRILNTLPLVVAGNIITEGVLIFSKDDIKRVAFETSVRTAYFDFLPVLRDYQAAYMASAVADHHPPEG